MCGCCAGRCDRVGLNRVCEETVSEATCVFHAREMCMLCDGYGGGCVRAVVGDITGHIVVACKNDPVTFCVVERVDVCLEFVPFLLAL